MTRIESSCNIIINNYQSNKMSIKINIPHYLRYFADGTETALVQGDTIGVCLADLIGQFPKFSGRLLLKENGELSDHLSISINGGEKLIPVAMDKPINDGDELTIIVLRGSCCH